MKISLYILKLTVFKNVIAFSLPDTKDVLFIVVPKVISYFCTSILSWLNANSCILLISRALNKLMFEMKAFFHYLNYIFVWDENQMAAF